MVAIEHLSNEEITTAARKAMGPSFSSASFRIRKNVKSQSLWIYCSNVQEWVVLNRIKELSATYGDNKKATLRIVGNLAVCSDPRVHKFFVSAVNVRIHEDALVKMLKDNKVSYLSVTQHVNQMTLTKWNIIFVYVLGDFMAQRIQELDGCLYCTLLHC